jgi:hypothetical protein
MKIKKGGINDNMTKKKNTNQWGINWRSVVD